jgi:hypothetical protein
MTAKLPEKSLGELTTQGSSCRSSKPEYLGFLERKYVCKRGRGGDMIDYCCRGEQESERNFDGQLRRGMHGLCKRDLALNGACEVSSATLIASREHPTVFLGYLVKAITEEAGDMYEDMQFQTSHLPARELHLLIWGQVTSTRSVHNNSEQ